ncbi:MAG TPA: arylsulfotransferase family protein [Parvularculaceae bacterium]|nr:arylsulfotransferase family protein [Parvularculaceae bacterium]
MAEGDAASRETAPVDSGLERLLMRPRTARFALWQALLAALVGVMALILFGSFALEGQEKNANILERAAHAISSAPITAKQFIADAISRKNEREAQEQRFAGEIGFTRRDGGATSGAALLLSRYDGDALKGVVELLDLDTGAVLHTWSPDIDAINARSALSEKIAHLKRDFNKRRYVYNAPLALDDGSLIFNGMDSPIVKIDVCGNPVWTVDGFFHHSLERDSDGNLWNPARLLKPAIHYVNDAFIGDAITKISPSGEIVYQKSVSQILIDNGLRHIVYSHDEYVRDPIHLNDIQPVPGDGPYWKKGDLFLSVRTPSLVLLYRPSTNEIVWKRQGPWLLQHDVDIISDHEIGVFNNNAVMSSFGAKTINANSVIIYDFDTEETRELIPEAIERNEVRTHTNGLFNLAEDGSLMIEEHNFGRLIEFAPNGDVRWTYINRAPKDGRVFHPGWSRYLEPQEASALKAAVEKADCGAQ